MPSVDTQRLAKQIFDELSGELASRPHEPLDRDREAAKIARLRSLRLARDAGAKSRKKPRLIVTR